MSQKKWLILLLILLAGVLIIVPNHILLWTLLVILVLLALLLIIPVRVEIALEKGYDPIIQVRCFFFKKDILTSEEEAPVTDEKEKGSDKKDASSKKEEQTKFSEKILQILDMYEFFLQELSSMGKVLRKFLLAINISLLELFLRISGDDPAEIATLTGGVEKSIFHLYAYMKSLFRGLSDKKAHICVVPDFEAKGYDYYFHLRLSVRACFLLPVAVAGLGIYRRYHKFKALE